jgi:hypothetical protein
MSLDGSTSTDATEKSEVITSVRRGRQNSELRKNIARTDELAALSAADHWREKKAMKSVMGSLAAASDCSPLPWRGRAAAREVQPRIAFDFDCYIGIGALVHSRPGSGVGAADQVDEPRFGGYRGVRL